MRAWWPGLWFLVACGGGGKGGDSGYSYTIADAAPDSDADTTASTGPEDSGVEDVVAPVWLSIGGFIQITYGEPDLATSAIELSGLDLDTTLLCTVESPPASFTPASPVPPGLVTWWDVGVPVDPGCGLPAVVRLGLGPYDPLLDPAADAAGVAGTPYGLYTLSDADDLWVFGVAGTSANFDGVEAPVAAPPLPDGFYRVQSLVLLPL
jgi:hypothetical protein